MSTTEPGSVLPSDAPPAADRKAQSKRIARDILFQTGSRYSGAVLGVARGLLIPRFLDPGIYGVYKTYQTVSELSRVLTAGVPSALFRELPIAQLRQEEDRRVRLLDNAFWSQVASALPVAAAFLIGGATGWIDFGDVAISPWFLLFIPLLFVDRTKIFFDVVFNGQKQFVLQAKIRLLDEFLTTLLCLGAAWLYGFHGLLVASIAVNGAVTAVAWWGSRYRLGASIDLKLAREMVGVGLPHMLNGLCNTAYNQLDRLVILGAGFGMTAVGHYSVGMTINDQVVMGAFIVARVIMPRMMEQYSARESAADIRHLVVGPARLAGLVYAPLVVLVAFIGDVVFHLLLPNYMPGLLPMKIMAIGSFFLSIWAAVSSFFLAIKKQWALMGIFAATIPLALVLFGLASSLGWGLAGIAAAGAVTDFVFGTAVLTLALAAFEPTWLGRAREIAKVYAPLPVAGAAVLVAHAVQHLSGFGGDPVRGSLLAAATFGLLYGIPAAMVLRSRRGRIFYGLDDLHG